MILIATSSEDIAGMTIREQLLAQRDWEECGTFENNPVYKHGEYVLVTVNTLHIFYDTIDEKVHTACGLGPFTLVVYISRHRSATNRKALTVHSIGNFGTAEHGGRDATLVPAAPHVVTTALRALAAEQTRRARDFAVCFEATHHGPYLETPCMYIEIGSDDEAWRRIDAGEAVAAALLTALERPEKHPVAVGIGGGHYAPRQTEVALEKAISFGHILPSYHGEHADETTLGRLVAATPDVEYAYFDRKSLKKQQLAMMEAWFTERGIQVVRKRDLA